MNCSMCIAIMFVLFMVLTLDGCATVNYPSDHKNRSHLDLMPAQKYGRISYRCNIDFNCRFVWKYDGIQR